MSKFTIKETETQKFVRSKSYNYNFDKKTGHFVRWGKTIEDDPIMAPFPEILDIEVEERCNGVPGLNGVESPCRFCYKSNTKNGRTMTFETFKKVFAKTILDEQKKLSFLTQIAFGADAGAKYNTELFDMMNHVRSYGVIPNITVANIDDETADKLAATCGAVAVSVYENKNIAYESIHKLTSRGMKQVNIHVMLSEETKDRVRMVMEDYLTDPRLKDLNAIVILSLKKKGRGEKFSSTSHNTFKELVDFAMSQNIPIGFDSCSYAKFDNAVKNYPNYKDLITLSENCESTRFSMYINVEGKFYSCSFCEESPSFPNGIDVVNCNDFMKDVWMHSDTIKWRKNAIDKMNAGDLSCPVYEV